MSAAPRASLAITILNDEDYQVLMSKRGGAEAFGVFVAMIVVGRQRLLDGKAGRLLNSDSLCTTDRVRHLSNMGGVTPKQMENCLALLAEVAKETSSDPWMYINENSQLVIRSFFKFNTDAAWGGRRLGSGRKSSRNQVESSPIKSNGLELAPVSVSVSVSNSVSDPPPPQNQVAAVGRAENDHSDVCRWAETLVSGWGPHAEGACKQYPTEWVREACSIAAEAGVGRWKFVDSVLGRFREQGRPDSAAPRANGHGRSPPPKSTRVCLTPEQLARLPEL